MGLTWAAGWALVGVLIGVTSRLLPGLPWGRFFEVFDAPLPALALPGFVGGVLFSVVLGIAARRRRFEELSLPRFAALGAFGGLLLSLVPAALEAVGLMSAARPKGESWRLTATIGVPLMLLSAVSAAASLALARKASRDPSRGDS
jgi:LytS/YehU family sensor histidine kinase